jgi:uncharacterized protein (DUF58 family)
MPRPQPEDFKAGAEYRSARKLWLRRHGGYLWTTLGLALLFGELTGSVVLLVSLVVFALLGTWYARSQPRVRARRSRRSGRAAALEPARTPAT